MKNKTNTNTKYLKDDFDLIQIGPCLFEENIIEPSLRGWWKSGTGCLRSLCFVFVFFVCSPRMWSFLIPCRRMLYPLQHASKYLWRTYCCFNNIEHTLGRPGVKKCKKKLQCANQVYVPMYVPTVKTDRIAYLRSRAVFISSHLETDFEEVPISIIMVGLSLDRAGDSLSHP